MRLTLIIAGIPQYTQAHYNLALAEYRTGNLVAAQDEALAALKLNNADAKGLILRSGARDDRPGPQDTVPADHRAIG